MSGVGRILSSNLKIKNKKAIGFNFINSELPGLLVTLWLKSVSSVPRGVLCPCQISIKMLRVCSAPGVLSWMVYWTQLSGRHPR